MDERGKKRFKEYFGKKDEERGGIKEGWKRLKKSLRETMRRVEREIKGVRKEGSGMGNVRS